MSAAVYMAKASEAGIKVLATSLRLEANEKNYQAACLTLNRPEQDKLREERHALTDALLDHRGEQQHYIRLSILSTK